MLLRRIDLHIHSTASDGQLTPEALMTRCKETGLKVVAVADHDVTAGVAPAMEAGRALGIKVIPAVELSVSFRDEPLHLLAYQVDLHNSDLHKVLAQAAQNRREHMERMITNLAPQGFVLSQEDYENIAKGLVPAFRQIVRMVMANPHNTRRLAAIKAHTENKFIEAMLEQGRPAHVPREKDIPVQEAISVTHQAGGVAVIAHPGLRYGGFRQLDHLPALICGLREHGLDGVESFHGKHNRDVRRVCHRLAQRLQLFETAGSDFHHPGQTQGELGEWESRPCRPRFPRWACP